MGNWLAAAIDYIPSWIELQMRRSEQPGCTVAVVHEGRVVLETAFGNADLTDGTRLTPRHRVRVASHSKTFTAAAIMKLRDRGALGLDDQAGKHVSGLHATLAQATLTQLLSHSAGVVRDGTTGDQWFGRRPFATAAELEAGLIGAPTLEANTRFKYSNYGYGLLGRVIESVTGESYPAWIQREIVQAAGLSDTTPDMPVAEGALIASGHSGKLPLGRRVVLPGCQSTNALAPATGFVSTAGDLARFFAQLLPSAKTSVLTVGSRREMVRAQWRNPHAALESHYGLGTMSAGRGDWSWFGNVGSIQGFMSRTATVPAHDVTVSIVANAIDAPANQWVDGVLNILAAFNRYGAPAETVREWSGRWWSIWGPVDLVPMGEQVLAANPMLLTPFADASEIAVKGRDTGTIIRANGFGSHGENVELVRAGDGRVREIRFAGSTLVSEDRVASELTATVGAAPTLR